MSKTKQSSIGNIGKRPTNVDKKPIGSFQNNAIQRQHIVDAAINEDKLSNSSVTIDKINEEAKDIYFNTQLTLTAYAGGGQANATQLNKGLNLVTVSATRLDSVKLPATFSQGEVVEVVNRGAKTVAIYPATDDTINGLAANLPVYLLPTNSMKLVANSDNASWIVVKGMNQAIDLSIVVSQANLTQSSNFGTLITNDAGLTYKLEFNIGGSLSGSINSCTLVFSNLTFKNGGSQSCSISVNTSMGQAYTANNSKNIECFFGGASGYIFVSGVVFLESHVLI